MTPMIYKDLARQTYSQEQFKKTIEQMLPMLMSHVEDFPQDLVNMMVKGMNDEYESALKIHIETLQEYYTEPQAATLHAFYNDNPWVVEKAASFSMAVMQKMMAGWAPNLTERVIEEYERHLDELDAAELQAEIIHDDQLLDRCLEETGVETEKQA